MIAPTVRNRQSQHCIVLKVSWQTQVREQVAGCSWGSRAHLRTGLYAGRNCTREGERGRERPPGFARLVAPRATPEGRSRPRLQ
jgi:hypothetical protein